MEITITINGKPVQATVDDAAVREAMVEKKPKKETGYERHERGQYYLQTTSGDTKMDEEINHPLDQKRYQAGNYYASKAVAENNARADRLMRQLRRFAAEHGGCGRPKASNSTFINSHDWAICCVNGAIKARRILTPVGAALFKDEDAAKSAIEAFHDELMWYFTEYDPMPEGWWDE